MEAQEVIYGMFVLSVRPHNCKSYSIVVLSGTCLSLTSSLRCFRSMIIPSSSSSCTVDDGLYFWRPPLVLAEQGSYCSYPPYGVLGDDYMLDILNQTTRSRDTSSTSSSCPEFQGISHWHHPCARDKGFISHHAPSFVLEYFMPLIDHGNNNGISPHQQHWMFSE